MNWTELYFLIIEWMQANPKDTVRIACSLVFVAGLLMFYRNEFKQ
jgi:hypothetical protein